MKPKPSHNTQNALVAFIIGVDENGNELTRAAQLTKDVFFPLSRGMTNNPIFVDFDTRVLDKYRKQPDAYFVWDMRLVCLDEHWSIPIDNYSGEKVSVLLPCLSKLPYEEQLHWRAHNIAPNGGVSEGYYNTYIKHLPFDTAEQPKHRFREAYYELRSKCYEYLGWQLLRPPPPNEEHYIADLTVPAPDEQRDFDALISSLYTLCIDALNVEALKKTVPEELRAALDRKDKLACFTDVLLYRGENLGAYGHFLRELQRLQCGSAVHRQACNHRTIANAFGFDDRRVHTVFTGILRQSIWLVSYFKSRVVCRDISDETREQRYERMTKGYAESIERLDAIAALPAASRSEETTDGSINHDVIYELDT